jgi:hypothetical protein
MDTNNTTEEQIFSDEYTSDSSTKSSSTLKDQSVEIDLTIDNIVMDDQNYSLTKPWRRIIKAIVKNG